MEKHMWLKEISLSFGMDTKRFSEFIGYSRQMLYQLSQGTCKTHPGRLSVAVYKLEAESERLLEKEIETAKANHERRKKLIEDFYDRLTT